MSDVQAIESSDMADTDEIGILDKKDIVGKRIQDREDERMREIAKRKEEAEKIDSKMEKTEVFMEKLTSGVGAIKRGLANASKQDINSLPSYFDTLSTELCEIQKFVTDSVMFLPSYDIAQKQQQLNDLQGEISLSRNSLLPKSKFAFKNRKKQRVVESKSPDRATESVAQPTNLSLSQLTANEYRINSVSNQIMKIDADSTTNKDIVISSITESTLQILGNPSAMHFTNLTDSTIVAGPCGRSIFIENCSNCVLVLACQQLRIHEAVNCSFFIHVTSRAIIEDSKGLKFAPYKLSYDGLEEHYRESGLNRQINNWYDVDDFNWLVTDKQSPNWTVIPEDARISHSI
ncbi:tubulin-specific chaperone C-like [Watersipora subatra]|uniref:tubulin-specific chaperone C-like n=1 Tax=Watersipora subatra TaxID=2589382 RepID=UPI00355C372C